MRRYSPQYYSPPGRGYGGGGRVRSRSPPPRRGHGGGGRRREQNSGSLLVRNIPIDVRPEELRVPFERFGVVRDVYIPKDYHTGGSATGPALRKLVLPFLEPRGFAFVQFVDSRDAMEAQHRMNGQFFAGREISVVVALETRKRPEEMRHRTSRDRVPSGHGGRSSNYGRSWSRSPSRSPRNHPDSRRRNRSRSYSPAPRRRDYSASPVRRHAEDNRSPRGPPPERDVNPNGRTYSPGYARRDNTRETADGYLEKRAYDHEEARERRPSPRRSSRSPSGSRSRSAEE